MQRMISKELLFKLQEEIIKKKSCNIIIEIINPIDGYGLNTLQCYIKWS